MSKTKQPLNVQVKLLVPYAIIVAIVLVATGFISGWHIHQSYKQSLDTQYRNGVASVSKNQE